MEASCCIIDYCDNGPDVCSTKMVRARLEHACCECGDPIRPGETYELVKGLWEGHWSTYKTCEICARIRQDFLGRCGWAYGCLWRDLNECFDGEVGP